MRLELIKAPQKDFLQMIRAHLNTGERQIIGNVQWGAVGLIQASLIDLYWAADAAAKASNVTVTMVNGNCPQHIQMLAIFGRQTDVQTAMDKVREGRRLRAGNKDKQYLL
ncbi:BMC domain-containing protein [Desulfogranum japonicum]|uniref:BMC domain-containing protein n=1 Tax=Desulfogranum japonicum TaxID=231447 RepID=UPI000411D825|nr:BMC domain-containing protein [Desulfogranum japonicum]